jgi:endonuclease/exonuclease/phosphatase family metal-dependent hydrolase
MFARTLAAVVASLLVTATASIAGATSGRVRVVTYNVAGLPDGVMTAHPSANMPRIGELLNGYDLVFVQEDFAYAAELRRTLRFPHATDAFVRGGRLDFGDGLSQFARLPFAGIEREAWRSCHGIVDSFFDCLTPKGFTYARQTLAPGVDVDVYNLHMDAGGSQADKSARAAQIQQLIDTLRLRSAGSAVIVAGDTNIPSSQRTLLARFEKLTGLSDACEALRCPEPSRIDRIFFRSSDALTLTPRRWAIDRRFVDARRRPLSDHLAVSVELEWATR